MTVVREEAPCQRSSTHEYLLRAARQMFEPDELEQLVPRMRGGPRLAELNGDASSRLDPIAATEAIAYDFLAKGGKYSRPFITLAAYAAMTRDQKDGLPRLTDAVRRAAVSIESFHKASLVHDDIQDGDAFRYGRPTLHVEHGIPTAINVGDYLIGLGYRLVSRDVDELGPETTADLLNKLAEAHTKLSEGQGAELVWRDSRNKRLSPEEAITIYALKTAPAFEAAFYCGLRLAGPAEHYAKPVEELAKHLGIAFQILNDLQDWQGDDFNKLTLGGDVLGGRPTVLWALALEGLDETDRAEVERIVAEGHATPAIFARLRRFFQQAGVFEKALELVQKHRARAEQIADELSPDSLRRLAHHLIEAVLEQPASTGGPRRTLAVPIR